MIQNMILTNCTFELWVINSLHKEYVFCVVLKYSTFRVFFSKTKLDDIFCRKRGHVQLMMTHGHPSCSGTVVVKLSNHVIPSSAVKQVRVAEHLRASSTSLTKQPSILIYS